MEGWPYSRAESEYSMCLSLAEKSDHKGICEEIDYDSPVYQTIILSSRTDEGWYVFFLFTHPKIMLKVWQKLFFLYWYDIQEATIAQDLGIQVLIAHSEPSYWDDKRTEKISYSITRKSDIDSAICHIFTEEGLRARLPQIERGMKDGIAKVRKMIGSHYL